MKRLALWAIVFPLTLAGTEVAHALAYRIVYPIASVRWHVLATSGHGYLAYVPIVLGIGAAVLVAGLASTVADVARRRPTQPLPAWAFASLPLVGFTVQEFVERLLATNTLPWWMFEQPTFRVGLLLQLPFALVAYLVARLLQRVCREIGEVIVGAAGPPAFVASLPAFRLDAAVLRPLSALGGAWRARGPPAPSV